MTGTQPVGAPSFLPMFLLVVLALGVGGFAGYEIGRPDTRTAQVLVAGDARRADSVATVIVHDTVQARRDSVLVYVPREHRVYVTDTLLQHDTTFLHDTIAVQAVAARDSATAGCELLRQDCAQQVAGLRVQVSALAHKDTTEMQLLPNWLQRHETAACTTTGVAGLVLGFLAGRH